MDNDEVMTPGDLGRMLRTLVLTQTDPKDDEYTRIGDAIVKMVTNHVEVVQIVDLDNETKRTEVRKMPRG